MKIKFGGTGEILIMSQVICICSPGKFFTGIDSCLFLAVFYCHVLLREGGKPLFLTSQNICILGMLREVSRDTSS